MAGSSILLERYESIGKLTFNRPEVLNAYNKTLSDEIFAGINELAEDNTVRLIVITGSGRAFMAGADIHMVNAWAGMGEYGKIRASMDSMLNPNILQDCPKPIIAAVNGLAFGMGCEIAIACDYRIAAASAVFGQPEIKIGVIPGGGGTQRLLHLVGRARALEMITTGDSVSAEEAYRIGLVNRVVPDENLWEAVDCFAKQLLRKSSVALQYCKQAIYQGENMSIRDGLDNERSLFCRTLSSEDAKEGTAAFLEKRKPNFRGK